MASNGSRPARYVVVGAYSRIVIVITALVVEYVKGSDVFMKENERKTVFVH